LDYRKVIKFGNSSHVVSLPKEWLEKNSLKKGDSIFFEENTEGLLLRSDPGDTIFKKKEITISTEGKNKDVITREIFAAYINGNNVINIEGNNLKEFAREVREQLNNLAGTEIIEQTNKRIVAKDFLRIEDVSLIEIIKKMDVTTRAMIEESLVCKEKETREDIALKDMDVNRLFFLVYRTIKTASQNSGMAKALNLYNHELIGKLKLVDSIENVADEAKRIARFFIILEKNKSKELDQIKKIYKEVEKNFADIMNAFYDNDKKQAHMISSYQKELISKLEDMSNKTEDAVVGRLIEKLKSMCSNIKGVARLIYY